MRNACFFLIYYVIPIINPFYDNSLMRRLYLVVPAYNEEKRIGRALDDYAATLINDSAIRAHIIVVSDSNDGTDRIVEDFSGRYGQITLIKNRKREGKGGSLLKGFAYACRKAGKYDIIGFVDADDAVRGSEVKRLFRFSQQDDVDGIIGSRYMPLSRLSGSLELSRKIASRFYNLFVKLLFRLEYTDTQCSAKFFKRYALERVLPRIVLKDLTFDVNLLYALKEDGARIVEVPIIYHHVKYGTKVILSTQIFKMFISTITYRLHITRSRMRR